MKVNMTPNPLDVVTIHASQGDTEARQWEFELHNNGELINTSDVKEQLVFKAYKGGTEQLLPENGSTPTTSPFKGDIRYPQGLLSDQEFTYRQSPTDEDGLAKITDIKGNTIVWNQLVKNGNFADTSNWVRLGTTYTVSNNVATVVPSADGGSRGLIIQNMNIKANHKYLISYYNKPSKEVSSRAYFYASGSGTVSSVIATTCNPNIKTHCIGIITPTVDSNVFYLLPCQNGAPLTTDVYEISNVCMIDLTQIGLDSITDPSEFTSLFPLPYYSYNQGSLLSFNGNGIKTVGFNQWDEEWELGSISNVGGNISSTTEIRAKNYIRVMPNQEYYFHASVASTFNYRFYDADKRFISAGYIGRNNTLLTPNGVSYMRFYMGSAYGTTYKNDICINISDTERNGQYEPYTSSTLSLPISTYFPTGMKSAGSVYDELTESKAITRIGAVDLGSLNWTNDVANRFYSAGIANVIKRPNDASEYAEGLICAIYTPSSSPINEKTQMQTIAKFTNGNIYVLDDRYSNDATAFKNSLNGVYLYYELATPTETSFTTASLVTENAEIQLSNEDGVLIGKCTEQLSENPGFIDAKIKLTDSDGECYSNKIQLHVERSPQ